MGLHRAGFDVTGVDVNPQPHYPFNFGLPRILESDRGVARRRVAMGIDWMPGRALSQAIPPAYAEFIGRDALRALEASA